MKTSRELFEAFAGPMDFDLTHHECAAPEPWSEYLNEATGYLWAGWKAGRESMRKEAGDVAESFDSHQYWTEIVGPRIAKAIRRIEP
jgi:hypothetical protein